MPLAQTIRFDGDRVITCVEVASRWQIDPRLAARLIAMAGFLPWPIQIFSGYRTPERQAELGAQPDSTAAPVDRSTHTTCPATGADVKPLVDVVTIQVKRQFGAAAETMGLRWGGGAQRENGIPVGVEWMHVDLGPRQQGT